MKITLNALFKIFATHKISVRIEHKAYPGWKIQLLDIIDTGFSGQRMCYDLSDCSIRHCGDKWHGLILAEKEHSKDADSNADLIGIA